ncbi:MAG: hypothetical protein U5J83_16535 [Bryobacterales bacterium]|nr:hypothetical protein [Bryobacterales bacterium]
MKRNVARKSKRNSHSGFVPPKPVTAPAEPAPTGFVPPNPFAERNRQNAAHSTGPRTADGKAASSKNAFKHGLSLQRHVVLRHEDPDLFDQLHDELIAIYEPQSSRESLAVEEIAQCRWALRRFDEAETSLLDYHLNMSDVDTEDRKNPCTPARALAYSCIMEHGEPKPLELPSIENLLRYRRHWERRHKEALAEFDRAQRARFAQAREARAEADQRRKQELHELRLALAKEKLHREQAKNVKTKKEREDADAYAAMDDFFNSLNPISEEEFLRRAGFVSQYVQAAANGEQHVSEGQEDLAAA